MLKKNKLLLTISFAFIFIIFFFGCDGNFGVKNIDSTIFVIKTPKESNIEVFYKSEKLLNTKLIKCDEILTEETLDWILVEKNIQDKNNVKIFDIPTYGGVNDRYNIDIYFEAIVNNEKYVGNIFIKSLQEDRKSSSTLFSEPVKLYSTTGKILSAEFCYQFWRSI